MDLDDANNVLASPGLVDFAVRHGLHDASSGAPFNWLRSFVEDTGHDVVYNYPRVAFLQGERALHVRSGALVAQGVAVGMGA